MTMIRRYGDYPAVFVPDEGEVVLISRSHAGPFLKAVVVKVRRASRDMIRVDFVWQEATAVSASGTGHRVGEKGNVYIHKDDKLPLIRRIPAKRPPSGDKGREAA